MRRESNGFILVSVLLAATMLLTSATAFAWFARTEARIAASRENILKFRGVAEIAVNALSKMINDDKNGYDSMTEELYARTTKLSVGNYEINAQIRPLNDKISVSGLLLPDGVTIRSEYETAWQRIWEELELPDLAASVIDFIDKDESQKLGGAERESNINRLVSDLNELKAMEEINDGVLWGTKERAWGLARYLDVPGGQKININVARPEMLAKLDEALSLSHAQNIASYALVSPIKSIEELRRVPGFPASLATKLVNVIGFESTHFLLSLNVRDKTGNQRNYRVVVQRGSSGIFSWEE
ncbi:MAG: type II secretion system protein GspK [Synergistaceae bacterium]|nr:type II secretion system protein GspK [Synergistaceae bacterium]